MYINRIIKVPNIIPIASIIGLSIIVYLLWRWLEIKLATNIAKLEAKPSVANSAL